MAYLPLLIALLFSCELASAKVLEFDTIFKQRQMLSPNMQLDDLKNWQSKIDFLPNGKSVGTYVIPNEQEPHRLLKLFKSPPKKEGIYVSVGTERGFIAAAISQSSHLVLIDVDQYVLLFNLLNIALLKGSTSREDYLHLRLSATHDEWIKKSKSVKNRKYRQILQNEKNWLWWQDQVANSDINQTQGRLNGFSLLHYPDMSHHTYFNGANYLYEDHLFEHLKNMADNKRIVTYRVDLRNSSELSKFNQLVSQTKLKIQALDLSNTWYPTYLDTYGVLKTVKLLSSSLNSTSKIILTVSAIRGWNYVSLPYNKIIEHDSYSLNNLLTKAANPRFNNMPNCKDVVTSTLNNV